MSKQIPKRVRADLRERAQECCEICGAPHATNAHHRRNQSQGGLDVLSNLMLACGSGTTGCHGKITANPDWAAEMGYTVKGKVIEPADVEVWRFDITQGVRVLVKLTDDGEIIPQAAA
ncbi:HNH endonuclease [Mycobacterium sp. BK086]|uniref:HNH endonuclease n=1 Tax=Mycobacterium sp. BK086 TaxID=2512165 RepID=UPI00105FB983|nr:HNH endonuclease signature motif containing protein [Mycobacterium sp. BK086]TDO18171.1 HNH endonuclease [Mycobacterium sp. BK086]